MTGHSPQGDWDLKFRQAVIGTRGTFAIDRAAARRNSVDREASERIAEMFPFHHHTRARFQRYAGLGPCNLVASGNSEEKGLARSKFPRIPLDPLPPLAPRNPRPAQSSEERTLISGECMPSKAMYSSWQRRI